MIVAIFAVLFGLVGAYAVRRYLEPPPPPAAAAEQPITIPLASIDLDPGRPIRLGDIVLGPFSLAACIRKEPAPTWLRA
jgi:hypothetical protein